MLSKLSLSSQNKLLAGSFVIFVILYFSLNQKNKVPLAPDTIYADTLIPKGHVLVPIELANLNAVAGLINQFGVIDLYGGNNQEDSVQIATRIKILRAPLNPNQYAVLVNEELSKHIMRFKGPFWASIQNRSVEPASQDSTRSDLRLSDKKDLPEPAKITKANYYKTIEIEYYKKDEDL